MRIGVISDTHGRFDPALPRIFAGVDLIVHAGDVGRLEVIAVLEAIAPVSGSAIMCVGVTLFPGLLDTL